MTPRAHQSRPCPSAPVPELEGGQGEQCSREKVHSDTPMICLSLGYVPRFPGDVISLSHFSPPRADLHLDAKRKALQRCQRRYEKKKASQQLLAAGGMIATVRLQSVI